MNDNLVCGTQTSRDSWCSYYYAKDEALKLHKENPKITPKEISEKLNVLYSWAEEFHYYANHPEEFLEEGESITEEPQPIKVQEEELNEILRRI